MGEQKRRKRRKKRKIGKYLYALVVMLLMIANFTMAFLLLFHVQKIEITGMQYSSQGKIMEWIQEDKNMVNSIYAYVKFKTGKVDLPVYLQDVSLHMKAPWNLQVQVKEKEIVAGIMEEGKYLYFAKDGLIMEITTQMLEGVPLIEGITSKTNQEFVKLEVEDEEIFHYIFQMIDELKRQNLQADRILWTDTGIDLYFQQVCVEVGKSDYSEKLTQLPPILEKLEGKSGVLHMEHYMELSTNISFEETQQQKNKN